MHARRLNREQAFDHLRRRSQDTNVKLHTIADELVQAAESAVEVRHLG